MARNLDMESRFHSAEDTDGERPSITLRIEGKEAADDCQISIKTLYGQTSMSLGDFQRIAAEVAKYRALKAEADREAA